MPYRAPGRQAGKHQNRNGARMRGFTLMEIMVVVVILGIVAAIAYPSYQESVRKTRRAEAKTALSDLAAREEQYFNDNKTYTSVFADLGVTLGTGNTTEHGYYTLTIAPVAGSTIANSYLLTATPAGIQASDSKCTSLTLTSSGSKGSTPSGSSCW